MKFYLINIVIMPTTIQGFIIPILKKQSNHTSESQDIPQTNVTPLPFLF